MSDKNMALEALLSAGKEHAPAIPEDLLKNVYEIQINRQFEKSPEIRLQELSRLVELYVNTIGEQGGVNETR